MKIRLSIFAADYIQLIMKSWSQLLLPYSGIDILNLQLNTLIPVTDEHDFQQKDNLHDSAAIK